MTMCWRPIPSPAPLPPEEKAQVAPEEKAIPIQAKPQIVKKLLRRPGQHRRNMYSRRNNNIAPHTAKRLLREFRCQAPAPRIKTSSFRMVTLVSRFGWYVDVIKRTVSQNWYSQLADPNASMGHSVIVTFVVHRDGSVSDPRIAQSSGVPLTRHVCHPGGRANERVRPIAGRVFRQFRFCGLYLYLR